LVLIHFRWQLRLNGAGWDAERLRHGSKPCPSTVKAFRSDASQRFGHAPDGDYLEAVAFENLLEHLADPVVVIGH
jgi:hypothetical protein